MSTTIYFIRHGESQANERNVFLGHHDLDLTRIGYKQAQATAEYLKNQVGRPDVIYSSDLSRAYHTAQSTAQSFDMPIIKNSDLREIEAGLWDTLPFDDLKDKFAKSYGVWMNNIGCARCDGGESVEELQRRIITTITAIAKKHDDRVVFIFTHATPIRVFAAHCLNKPLEEVKDIPWVANASVTKVVCENGKFQLMDYGRYDFMGDIATVLPDNV